MKGLALSRADVPLEEAPPFCDAARMVKIDPILFVSQTTSPARMEGAEGLDM